MYVGTSTVFLLFPLQKYRKPHLQVMQRNFRLTAGELDVDNLPRCLHISVFSTIIPVSEDQKNLSWETLATNAAS